MRPEPYHHKVTRYRDPTTGKRCRPLQPGAVRSLEETATYYGEIEPLVKGARAERVSLETTDLGQAWETLRRLRSARTRELEGLADPTLKAARRPLAEHLEEWRRGLTAAGQTEKNARQLYRRVSTLAESADWARITDITLSSADEALACLASERTPNMPEDYEGRGPQTCNHYRSHLRQFVRWLVADGRLARDPLMKLAREEVAADLRRSRRCPTDEEITTLFAHLHSPDCKVRLRMSGLCRALCYRVAMATGFRGGEVRTLTRASFDLVAGTVTAQAGYSKRRRKDTQPLPSWLVELLAPWLADPRNRLWNTLQADYPGRVLRDDLQACGVPYVVDDPAGPLYFDFHALRHWYVTQIADQPGISPKTLMTLARHSTPSLSLKVYAHGRAGAERAAVANLPHTGRVEPTTPVVGAMVGAEGRPAAAPDAQECTVRKNTSQDCPSPEPLAGQANERQGGHDESPESGGRGI